MSENSPKEKIKRKHSEELSCLSYKKRKGTTDLGKLYEEYFPVYVILQLLQNMEVKDFRISTNDEEYGSFDDLVLEVEQINKPTEKCAIQLKHINNRELTMNNLRTRGNFNIMKYYVSFQQNNELLSGYKLILYTNSKFTPNTDATIDFIGNYKSVIKVKRTECDPLQFLKTEYGKSFQFHLYSENSDENKGKYKNFFDRLFLCTDQMNVQTLEKKYIPQSLGTLTSKLSVQDKFLKFISVWSQIEGTKDKLTKDMMIKVMTLHIVEELIQPHTFCEVNEKQKLFRNAVSHFNITAFRRRSLENVVKIWGDSKHRLRDRNIKEINEIIRRFQICTKHVQNMDDLTDEESTKLLWVMDECPLIIKGDLAAYEATKLCGGNSKFVFITDELNVEKLEDLTILKKLSDLKPHEATYSDISKNLSFRLFGEETSLENLIKNDDAIHNLITTDEIAKIADNVDLIKLEEEELCFPYIKRYLYKNIIDSKYLQKIDGNTMALISYVGDEKKLRDGLQHFEIVSITKELHKDTDGITFGTNQDRRSEKSKLVFNKTETSPEEFRNLCNKNKKYEKFHHFRYHNEHLEWIESIGDVSDLQKFCIQSENFIEDEKLYAEKVRSNLHIIVGNPGMGKSIFIKNLKNNLLSKYFTVMIRPIDVPELCRFVKDPGNLERFFTFIVESKFPNCGNFQKQILRLLMNKGKAIFLWDALDELSEENRIFVEKIIAALLKKSSAQFLTTRAFLRKQLEDNFKSLSQDLQPFNDKQQTDYIHKRLQDSCSDDEELKSITTAIKENITKITYREILGIPLHIYMLTELFRQDLEKYKKLFTELFVITDLYSYFIREKFNFYFKNKKGYLGDYNEDRSLKRHIKHQKTIYQKLALKLLFGSTSFEHPNTELENFLNEIKKEGDEFGFIIAVDNKKQPEFLHNSYAEYFAATYLAENCRNIPNLENVIFDTKYANVRYFFDTLLAKDSPVHIAVLCKDLKYLKNCKEGDNFKRKDEQGRNALHLAASWGERYPLLETTKLDFTTVLIHDNISFETKKENLEYFQIIEILLENCDPEDEDQLFKLTPRMYAKKCECLLAVALIVKKQANRSSFKTEGENFVYSVLYYGIKYGFQDFLNFSANIEFACTKSGSTLLHMAVQHNQFQYLSKLLGNAVFKRNIDYKHRFGETALFIAVEKDYVDTVKYLIKNNANVNAVDNFGSTTLHRAVPRGHFETMKYLIQEHAKVNAVDDDGSTPLHKASLGGHFETLKYLIREHANVNAVDNDGWTPLHDAAFSGHLEIVKYLIQEHANVNAVDDGGSTPLHKASLGGHFETLKYLIREHANVNAVDNDGLTPLHDAAFSGHLEIVKYLIEKGPSITIASLSTTILGSASFDVLENVVYLTEHGVNVDAADGDGLTPLMAASNQRHLDIGRHLIQQKSDINASDKSGCTPLHWASDQDHLSVVKLLVKAGAGVDAYDRNFETPLTKACARGNEAIVQYLIKSGASVNWDVEDRENPLRKNPLHNACENGHKNIVEILLEAGADYETPTIGGQTYIDVAIENHYEDIVELLRTHKTNFTKST